MAVLPLVFAVAHPGEAQGAPIASAWKITVRADGLYRLTGAALLAAGVPADVDPRRLRLTSEGVEQAIRVRGEEDGRLDATDALELYGRALDSDWSDTRAYFLTIGASPGKRMAVRRSGADEPTVRSFLSTVTRRDRSAYVAAIRNGAASNFFGPLLEAGADPTLTLAAPHRDASDAEDAQLDVSLQGISTGAHAVAVRFSRLEMDQVRWQGQQPVARRVAIPAWLVGDSASVSLSVLGGGDDHGAVDRVALTYRRLYIADEDHLACTVAEGAAARIDGLGRPTVRVFDVTAPEDPAELEGLVRPSPSTSGYSVTVRPGGSGERALLVAGDAWFAAPVAIRVAAPPDSTAPAHAADLVILTHATLVPSMNRLAEHRRAQGLRVEVFDVEALYDEFSFGEKDPLALRAFLAAAHDRWSVAPRFVLLAGQASVDPRGFLGGAKPDLVPTRLVDTAAMESASDDWFADFRDDLAPQMAIGRLPVVSAAQADAVVQKWIAYDAARAKGDVGASGLFVSGDDQSFDFHAASHATAVAAPSEIAVEEFRGGAPGAGAHQRLIDRLNQGSQLVNYFGQGSVADWSGLLTSDEVEALTNAPRLPIVVAMTSLNGMFDDAFADSLAVSLVRAPHGGAVAVWACSSVSTPDMELALDRALLAALPGRTLGEAVIEAKRHVTDPDLRRSWILFGDPTIAATPPPAVVAASTGCSVPPGARRGDAATGVLFVALLAVGVARRRRGAVGEALRAGPGRHAPEMRV